MPASSASWIKGLLPFVVMCSGMFIALLDIQIVASSLQDIGGGLSAAQDEIAWVQTAYLIAEIIMIPLSGWLTRAFSTRWLFAASAAGFTLASLLCGLAWNIESMIVFRALQGLLGASMIPTVFTSSFHYFDGQRRVYAAAVIGTIASIAPTLGPVIGGWITDTLNWHWLFYINLVPGTVITILVPMLVRIDEPDLKLLRGADYPGIVLMAIGLGTLEYTLEEGTRWNWFSDSTITTTAWIAGISLILFAIRSLTHRNPVVDLRAFRNRNFALGCLMSFVTGIGIFTRRAVADRHAGLHHARQAVRSALADDVRPRLFWPVDVEFQFHHQPMERRRIADPAIVARLSAGIRGGAQCDFGPGLVAAGPAEVCQRLVQHDAQS